MNCLKKYTDINTALNQYESLRQIKSMQLSALENQSASLMVNDNLAELESFEEQMQYMDLATMYQELIPLVNEKSCNTLKEFFKSAMPAIPSH